MVSAARLPGPRGLAVVGAISGEQTIKQVIPQELHAELAGADKLFLRVGNGKLYAVDLDTDPTGLTEGLQPGGEELVLLMAQPHSTKQVEVLEDE